MIYLEMNAFEQRKHGSNISKYKPATIFTQLSLIPEFLVLPNPKKIES